MYKRVIWFAALQLMLASSAAVRAQETSKNATQFELDFVWGAAQGSFGDNIDRLMPGLFLSIGGQVPNSPLALSTEFGWLNYGFDDHLELLLSDPPAASSSTVNVDASNYILMAHLVGKIIPYRGRISPYIDGLVGFKYLVSKVNVESQAIFDNSDNDFVIVGDNQIRTSSDFDSFAFSYGAGAGVNIQIFSGNLGMQGVPTTLSLQMGVRYLFGTKADYLGQNSILSDATGVRFEQITSDTDMLIPKFGFQLVF